MEKQRSASMQSLKRFELVVGQIEQRILNGELHRGDRLPTEHDLADQFQVSLTAVREALKILAQKGLVEIRPGRGTIVIEGTNEVLQGSLALVMKLLLSDVRGIQSLVEVREILEGESAGLAATRATEQELSAMREAVRVMDENLHDMDAFVAADNQFHEAIAQATQNALLLVLIKSIVNLLNKQRKQIFTTAGGPQRGQIHHKHLLKSVSEHDPVAARAAMDAHLKQVCEDGGLSVPVRRPRLLVEPG